MSGRKPANWQVGGGGSSTPAKPVDWRRGGTRGKTWAGDRKPSFWEWWKTRETHAPMKHTVRLILGFGIIVILVVAVSLLRPRRIRTPFVVLQIAEYENPAIPPNALAYEDVDWFSILWANKDEHGNWTRRDIGFWGDPDKQNAEKKTYVSRLVNNKFGAREFRPGGPDKDVVLVYVSAHGVTNSKNEPCLLLSDSDPYDESSWLPVKDFLKDIRLALGAKRRATKVVVFLDASRLWCQLRFGLLYNAFNEQLKINVESIADPNLVVINSASGGEVAWTAPERVGSIFGHFVAEGLSGFASDDDVITLGELADYLNDKVLTWTRAQRAAAQTPCVITTCATCREWKLARTSDTSRNAAREGSAQTKEFSEFKALIAKKYQASINDRNARLAGLWATYDRIVNREKATLAPLDLAELHFQLSRLEQLVLAGGAYDRAFDTSARQAAKLLAQLDATRMQPVPVALSLPLLSDDQGSRSQLDAFRSQWKATPISKQWKQEDVAAFSREVVAEVIVSWLVDDPDNLKSISYAQLDDAIDMLDKSPAEETPALVETNFLRMLKRYVDRTAVPARNKSLHRSITARRLAEQAAAPADHRAHYWIRTRCNLADRTRRLAQDQLFVGTPTALQQSEKNWSTLIDRDTGEYALVRNESMEVVDAYRVRDMCWACLPELVRWLTVKVRCWPDSVTADYLQQLADIVSQVQELSAMLDERFNASGTVATDPAEAAERVALRAQRIKKIGELVTGIRSGIRRQDRFFKDYNDCWDEKHERKDKTVIGRWQAMLEVPLTGFLDDADFSGVNGAKRNQRRSGYIQRLLQPDDDTNRGDKTRGVGAGSDQLKTPKGSPEPQNAAVVSHLAQFPSLVREILNRDNLPDATKTRSTLVAPAGDTPAQKRDFLAVQSGQIRPLLDPKSITDEAQRLIDLPEDSEEARRCRFHLTEADRLLRSVAGLTGPIRRDPSRMPAARLRAVDAGFFMLWHAQRVLLDLWNDDGNRYYTRAFEMYAQAAAQAGVTSRSRYEFDRVSLVDVQSRLRQALDEQWLANPQIAPDTKCSEDGDYLRFSVSAGPVPDLPQSRSFFSVRKSGENAAGSELILSTSKQTMSATAPGTRRTGLPIGGNLGDASRVTMWLEKARIGDDDQLSLTGIFRGRTRVTSLRVPNPRLGETFIVGPVTPQKPSVEVHSNPKKLAVMFVLDYSASMEDRYQKATDALISALDQLRRDQSNLPGSGTCRVGLLVFSHRIGWDDSGSIVVSDQWRKKHPGEIPKVLDTSEDANGNTDLELVLSLHDPHSKLSPQTIAWIQAESKTWAPLGNTPFYYAMSKALEEFQHPDLDAESRQLVFITDGNNELIGPPDWMKRIDALSVANVIKQGCQDVQVHILGLGTMSTVKGIDAINNVLNHDVDFIGGISSNALLQRIEASIGIGDFVVQDEDRLRAYQKRVGAKCVIDDWKYPAIFKVSMPDLTPRTAAARLFIEGGNEGFVLWRTGDGTRLAHRRFEPAERYPTPAPARDAFVSLLRPVRQGDGVTFPITIQNKNPEKFSPRPVGVWLEIQPTLTKDGANVGHAYHLYDMVFENGRPVPVLNFTIPQWPRQAFGANVRLWYRVPHDVDEAAQGIRDVDVEPQDLSSPEIDRGIKIEKFPGVTITARRVPMKRGVVQVIVDEYYEDAPQDIPRFRILAAPPAKQIERSYNFQTGHARHVFTFYPDKTPRKLLVTPRSRLWEEYSHLDKQPVPLKLTDD